MAFAANSVLCRLALGSAAIDAATFSTIRIVTGAAVLGALVAARPRGEPAARPRWRAAVALFSYAVAFSFAYVSLATGTGALILFSTVQLTMVGAGLTAGERPRRLEWLGLATAMLGLLYLVLPGLAAPSPLGSMLMGAAGVSWGLYSLWGRRATDPLGDTAFNFARAVPLTVGASLVTLPGAHLTLRGAALAAASGILASGLGYVAWYAALPRLTATRAATVQLAVPVLAAAGGTVWLGEPVTVRLIASAVLILGGISLAVGGRRSASLGPAHQRSRQA